MNNANMTGMNAMGGPVGGPGINAGPMMNNAVGRMPPGSMTMHHVDHNQTRSQLNTYIYEYFLKNDMFDCARAMLASKQPMNVDKNSRRRDDNGNVMNGASDDPMDTDNKDSLDLKRNEELPAPRVPISEECPDACFLFDWWCLFWDMYKGQHGKSERENIVPFINHTQNRLQQDRQQQQLRAIGPGQMNSQQYTAMMANRQNGDMARLAMQNRQTKQPMPQGMQMMHKQMQPNGAEMDGNRPRPQSPGAGENAPSPSKRPRIEGAGPFPGQQMPNGGGRGIPGQDFPNGNGNPNVQRGAMMKNYAASLSQQQKSQIPGGMGVGASPANQGSPMAMGMEGTMFDQPYNVPNGRGGPQGGGTGGQQGNHALQDYQMQLMLLEQQNKKRLMIARQEQDNMGGGMRQDGAPGAPFQGASPNGRSGASPNPNEMKRGTPQMGNTGLPGGPGSPMTDGQSRGSPAMNFNPTHLNPSNAPSFYAPDGMKGMEGGAMGQVMPNGMRPPSSHPMMNNGQPMTQQQMMAARQAAQQGGGQFTGFQPNPGAPMMMPQSSQGGGPPQNMGTPQQRAMPPPQAPAAGNAPNGQNTNRSNTQPSSPAPSAAPPTPQQSNKAAPGKNKKADEKPRKRPQKKGSVAALNSGATPSADGNSAAGNEGVSATTPTPATPVTPLHPNSFKNGQGNQQGAQAAAGQAGANNGGMNGQPGIRAGDNATSAAPMANAVQAQPIHQTMDYDLNNMDLTNVDFSATLGFNSQSGDVLDHFDFDSFLNNEPNNGDDNGGFNFDTSNFSLEGEVGAEG